MRTFENIITEHAPSVGDTDEVLDMPVNLALVDQEPLNLAETERKNRALEWIRKQQLKLALGVVAVSTVLTVGTDFEHTKDQVIEAAPWIGASLAASEVAWIGGGAMMLAGIGSKIGNPFKIRGRMDEIAEKANESKLFKTGFAINAAAAVGQAGILTEGIITNMPAESWGYLAFPALDLGATLVIRNKIWKGMKRRADAPAAIYDVPEIEAVVIEEATSSAEKETKASVRKARVEDINRLADIDLARYKRVYGENPPTKEEVVAMFEERLANASSDWMYVCEVNNTVEGFVTGFRTNKPLEEFVSWEDCTANGTLTDRVDPDGKYVYIANLTVNPAAMKIGGEDMLMANLLAQGIEDGIEYGYFLSRMPIFSAWLKRQILQGNASANPGSDELDALAKQYANATETVDGKKVRLDPELRMYEEAGFKMGEVLRDSFEDPQSLNYGILFKADVPPSGALKRSKIVRHTMAGALRLAAKNPKVLARIP
jgi:hypothetical protein